MYNWKLVDVERTKARRSTVMCIRYHFHEIQQYRLTWRLKLSRVAWPDSFEELWSLPLNGHGPYTFFVGSIHNVGHSYRTSGVRWFQFTWFQRVHPLPVFKRKKSFALISTSTISGWQSRTLHWINHRSYCGISDSATCSQISCFIENSIQGPVIWTGDDECTACDRREREKKNRLK